MRDREAARIEAIEMINGTDRFILITVNKEQGTAAVRCAGFSPELTVVTLLQVMDQVMGPNCKVGRWAADSLN